MTSQVATPLPTPFQRQLIARCTADPRVFTHIHGDNILMLMPGGVNTSAFIEFLSNVAEIIGSATEVLETPDTAEVFYYKAESNNGFDIEVILMKDGREIDRLRYFAESADELYCPSIIALEASLPNS